MIAMCPIANSLASYEAEYDRQQAYIDEISRRANELIDSCDLDALVEQMTVLEADRFCKSIAVICHCNTKTSREAATLEIRHLLNMAATNLATKQYQQEMDAAADGIAVERFYARMERCGE